MEKKFTRAMVCEEFGSKCRECPLYSANNPKSLACWLLDESDIQTIMDDYPYTDVKARMIFNDIETRLAAVENKVENNVSVEFKQERVVFGGSYNRDIGFSAEVVDKKLYDKREAKHESDCRLISEYDLEIKKLKETNASYWDIMQSLGERLKRKEDTIESWVKRYKELEEKYNKLLKDYKLLSESNNNHAKDNIELEGELEAKTLHIAAL
jgi:adenylate kinase family enzyme